jgi:regulator of protease activity HflC (stomatin/prohibitin superfamily)
MAEIKGFGPFRRLRSDASVHILRYQRGRLAQSGRGLAFWFLPDAASIAEAPVDDRDLPFLFNSRSKDFQEVTVQGMIVWRVADPEKLAQRIDFSIDLRHGQPLGQPVDQIATLLTGLAQQLAAQYLTELDVGPMLAAGVEPLRARMDTGLVGAERLTAMGLEVVSVRVSDVSPSSDLKRALQTPTFERLQQQADQATFERRALAVEKERAIAENELANQIELARREKELIATQDANARNRATAEAAAQKIAGDAEADRIRTVNKARTEGEKDRVEVYRDLPQGVMLGLAARDFAGKLTSIEHLNITPDLLGTLLGDAIGRSGGGTAKPAKGKAT